MNTKNLVIFGSGVLVGYLLTQYMMGNIAKGDGSAMPPPAIGGAGILPDLKQADCEKKMNDAMATMRFTSESDMEDFKNKFMADCLAS